MHISQARTILAKWLHEDQHGNISMPRLVVRVTAAAIVYNVPEGFAALETEALAVWVREATNTPGATAA